ncbi:MAG: DNA-binding transcriptional regulator [bacterium]
MSKILRVGIFVETSNDYGRRILSGISQYLKTNQNWSVFLEQNDLNARPYDLISSNQWDGILCRHTDPALASSILDRGIPLVDLNDQYQIPELSWVGSDHHAIGVMGAEYLKKRGMRHFAYCGFSNELWSQSRKESFGKTFSGYGNRIHLWESPWTDRSPQYWAKDINKIRYWIENLPKPIAIMAANDVRALHVIEACKQLNLVIPEQVSVMGVDDDETFCTLSIPHLTSIRPDCEKIGFQAAELLDGMMSSSEPYVKRIVIQPKEVIVRPSTDIRAVSDSLVAKAIKKLHRKDSGHRDIKDVAKELKISRNMLDRRFGKALNRSSSHVLRWVLIARIQQLLLDTDYTLTEIAKATGFINSENMKALFKANMGFSPGTYRQNHVEWGFHTSCRDQPKRSEVILPRVHRVKKSYESHLSGRGSFVHA